MWHARGGVDVRYQGKFQVGHEVLEHKMHLLQSADGVSLLPNMTEPFLVHMEVAGFDY